MVHEGAWPSWVCGSVGDHGSVVQLGPQVTTMAQTEWLVGKHDGGGVLAFLLWNFSASIAHESGPSAVTGAMASMMHGRMRAQFQ